MSAQEVVAALGLGVRDAGGEHRCAHTPLTRTLTTRPKPTLGSQAPALRSAVTAPDRRPVRRMAPAEEPHFIEPSAEEQGAGRVTGKGRFAGRLGDGGGGGRVEAGRLADWDSGPREHEAVAPEPVVVVARQRRTVGDLGGSMLFSAAAAAAKEAKEAGTPRASPMSRLDRGGAG